jgi:hypothetical protein
VVRHAHRAAVLAERPELAAVGVPLIAELLGFGAGCLWKELGSIEVPLEIHFHEGLRESVAEENAIAEFKRHDGLPSS